jgi:hypothetical protein
MSNGFMNNYNSTNGLHNIIANTISSDYINNISSTELNYLLGTTGNVQSQINLLSPVSSVSYVQGEIDSLITRITTDETTITNNISNITLLNTRIVANETNITSNIASISSLNTRITTDEANITNVSTLVSTHTSQISSLNTRITTDETNITNISTLASTHTSQLTLLQTATTNQTFSNGIINFNDSLNISGGITFGDGTVQITASNPISSCFYANNWTAVSGTSATNWTAISISSDGKYQTAWVSTSGYIYTSSDYGVTFSSVTGPGLLPWMVGAISKNGKYQLAGLNTTGVYMSNDYGVTWTATSNSLLLTYTRWRCCAINSNGQYQIMSTIDANLNVIISSDFGVTWTSKQAHTSTVFRSVTLSASGQYQTASGDSGGLSVSKKLWYNLDNC